MNHRRVFLKVLGASALTSACGGDDTSESSASTAGGDGATSSSSGGGAPSGSSSGAGGGSPSSKYEFVAKVDDVSEGVLKPVATASVLVGRDNGGVYVMTSICTHNNCDMSKKGSVDASGVTCKCHDSKFDANGNPTEGPALKPLVHYDCIVDDEGSIGVDSSKVVAPSFRAPIP